MSTNTTPRTLPLGYTGPVRVISEEYAASLRAKFYETAGLDERRPGPAPMSLSMWHWVEPWVQHLVEDPVLLDRVEEVIGPDIAVWNTHFWYKPPGAQKPVPWHQDGMYWKIQPRVAVTAWVALSAATRDNGCLRIAPKADQDFVEHREVIPGLVRHLNNELPESEIAGVDVADVEMRAGEALLFDAALVHCSRPNTTEDQARLALSIRYVPTDVHFDMESWTVSPERVRLRLVRGEDRLHLNDDLYGPPAGFHAVGDRRS